MDIYNLIGYTGTFLYLLSYALLNFNKITGNSATYISMNLIAAICVCISLTAHWNAPSFVIQSCWIIFSIIGLIKIYKNKDGKALQKLNPMNKNTEITLNE